MKPFFISLLFLVLVTNPKISLSQTNKKVELTDSIINFFESLQSAITNKKCDSTYRTGLSRSKVKNSLSCILFKEDLFSKLIRIDEEELNTESCTERYTYYFYNKRLIKVTAQKGNSPGSLLIDSMIYYELDKPIFEIQKRIELTPEYPIQRAYELVSFVSND